MEPEGKARKRRASPTEQREGGSNNANKRKQ